MNRVGSSSKSSTPTKKLPTPIELLKQLYFQNNISLQPYKYQLADAPFDPHDLQGLYEDLERGVRPDPPDSNTPLSPRALSPQPRSRKMPCAAITPSDQADIFFFGLRKIRVFVDVNGGNGKKRPQHAQHGQHDGAVLMVRGLRSEPDQPLEDYFHVNSRKEVNNVLRAFSRARARVKLSSSSSYQSPFKNKSPNKLVQNGLNVNHPSVLMAVPLHSADQVHPLTFLRITPTLPPRSNQSTVSTAGKSSFEDLQDAFLRHMEESEKDEAEMRKLQQVPDPTYMTYTRLFRGLFD